MLLSLEVIDVNLVCGKFAAKLPIIFQLLLGQRGTFLYIFVKNLWHICGIYFYEKFTFNVHFLLLSRREYNWIYLWHFCGNFY